MIKVQEISFGYERTRLILEKISFSVKSGESVAILGNNGAGAGAAAEKPAVGRADQQP